MAWRLQRQPIARPCQGSRCSSAYLTSMRDELVGFLSFLLFLQFLRFVHGSCVPTVSTVRLQRLRCCFEVLNQADRCSHCSAGEVACAEEFAVGDQSLVVSIYQVVDHFGLRGFGDTHKPCELFVTEPCEAFSNVARTGTRRIGDLRAELEIAGNLRLS